MVDDEYIINLKNILGVYLVDNVARFDVLVEMITSQLLASNKIGPTQGEAVRRLLGHALDDEPSSLLSAEMAHASLSDILNFCRRADVKDSLKVCDRSTGMVSDLTTEYEALLSLFRISGDHSGIHHATITPLVPFGSSGQSSNVTSTSNGFMQNNYVGTDSQQKGFYSNLYNPSAVVIPAGQQLLPQMWGGPSGSLVGSRETGGRSTAAIISRAHQLAVDNHFGRFTWYEHLSL